MARSPLAVARPEEFDSLGPAFDSGEAMTVDLTGDLAGPTIDYDMGGDIVVDFGGALGDDGDEPDNDLDDFYENLAEDPAAAALGQDLIEKIKYDIESRAPWYAQYRKGLALMGLVKDDNLSTGFIKNASRVLYPLLGEATVQFQARAYAELFPPDGPVKPKIVGEKTQDVIDQGDRVADHMNYQLTEDWPEYLEQEDKLLMVLPIAGSAFKKVYIDPDLGRPTSIFLAAEDVIVPYQASSLDTAERITHRQKVNERLMEARQARGVYRACELAPPSPHGTSDGAEQFDDLPDEADARQPVQVHDDDAEYIVYETLIWARLEDDPLADPTIRCPYIITIEAESGQVLALRRNWRRDDQEHRRRQWYVHKYLMPGPGFYGLGYFHLIGGLAEAATYAVRALLDSAAAANYQGGFRARQGRGASGEMTLEFGVWKEVDVDAEDLAKAFFNPPFKEPSRALFELLGLLVEAGRRFASITEAMAGDAPTNGPVGTTVALIEQGSKVYSGIHGRLHRSLRRELGIIAELNGEWIPEDGYPYEVEGASRRIMASDYDSRVDVIPVSDPNIVSNAQRIATAQATLELAERRPDLYDMLAVHRRMHDALGTPAADDLLIDPTEIERADAVTENQMMLLGKPTKVFPDQDHQAHLAVHTAFLKDPRMGGDKIIGQIIGPAMMAHMAEHLANAYRLQMERAMQAPLLVPDLHAQRGTEVLPGELTPDMERAISQRAAQAVQITEQQQGGQQGDEGGGDPAMMTAQARMLDAKTKAKATEAEIARETKLADAKVFTEAAGVMKTLHEIGQSAVEAASMRQKIQQDGQQGRPAPTPRTGGN